MSVDLPNIKNITVSGRIGAGTTTLATGLSETLGWSILEGGALFASIHLELNLSELDVKDRPDSFDISYEERIKKILKEKNHQIIQSHLAGFDAQGIPGVFKILVVCEDANGNDKTEIRIDRLVNRRKISIEEAKHEVAVREKGNLDKWRRLYANNDPTWVNWDRKYYDLAVNSFTHNKEQTLEMALKGIGYKNS